MRINYLNLLVIVFTALLFFTNTIQVYSIQPETMPLDSLIQWVEENVQQIVDTEETKHSYDYAYIALRRAKAAGEYHKIAQIHESIAFWHYLHIDSEVIDSILYHDQQALKNYELAGADKKIAKTLTNIATSYAEMNKFQEAEVALFKALRIYERLEDLAGQSDALSELSSCFIETNAFEDAIKYGEQAIAILEKLNQPGDLGIALFYLVPAYIKTGALNKALQTAQRSIDVIESEGDDKDPGSFAHAIAARGNAYQAMGKLDLALKDNRSAWNMIKGLVVEEEKADGWKRGIAKILFLQKKYEAAIPYYEDFFQHMRKRNNVGDLWDSQLELAKCYEYTGNAQKALLHYHKAWAEKDSMQQSKIASLQSELQIKYETEKKDATINDQSELIQQQNKIQWLSFGLLGLFSLLLGVLFWGFRKNQRKNQKLGALNNDLALKNDQNELLLKEIHHRVKNNLQVISSLLSFQSRSVQEKNVKNALLDSQSRVRSMSLIHQKLYRGANLAAIEMKTYFETLTDSLIDAYENETEVEVKLNMPSVELDVDYAIPLGLIANELLTNSLKYAFRGRKKGTIEIELQQEANEFVLDIKDNGIGKLETAALNANGGFGSELVEMLTEQLKGNLTEFVQNGYQTQIRFPYAKAA